MYVNISKQAERQRERESERQIRITTIRNMICHWWGTGIGWDYQIGSDHWDGCIRCQSGRRDHITEMLSLMDGLPG